MRYSDYKRIWNGVIARHESAVLSALRNQMSAFADQLEADKTAYPWELPTAEIRDAVSAIHIDAGVRWGRSTVMDLERMGVRFSTTKDALGDLLEAYVSEFLRLYLLDRAVQTISDTTRREILAIMQEGLAEGWGAEKIARAIRDSGLTIVRARLIARTEATTAMNSGSMLAAVSGNTALRKGWVSAQTNRTRRVPRDQFDHLTMDGTFVEFDEKYQVPAKLGGFEPMDYPGAPGASAGNVCNCRCAQVYRTVRDNAGSLVGWEKHNPRIVNNQYYQVVQGVKAGVSGRG